MPIAFDTIGSTEGGPSGSSFSWNHTITNGLLNTFLIVIVWGRDSSFNKSFSGVTYNGAPMTRLIGPYQVAGPGFNDIETYYLVGPTSDGSAHAIVASAGSSFDSYSGGMSLSYSGVDQTSPIDSFNSGNDNSFSISSLTVATTVIAANCWLLGYGVSGLNAISAGAGVGLVRINYANVFGGGSQLYSGDSNGIVGTGSQSTTWVAAGNQAWDGNFSVSIAPAVAAVPGLSNVYFDVIF